MPLCSHTCSIYRVYLQNFALSERAISNEQYLRLAHFNKKNVIIRLSNTTNNKLEKLFVQSLRINNWSGTETLKN